jgi:hypothetical protein
MPFDDFRDWSNFYKQFDNLKPDRFNGLLAIIMPASGLHEYVRRHILHFNKVMPDWAHLIIVENRNEHSYVPDLIPNTIVPEFKMKVVKTADNRPWVMGSWFNMGARHTEANYIMPIGLDHFIPKSFFDTFPEFVSKHGNLFHFAIYMEKDGILDENGDIVELGQEAYSHTPHGMSSMGLFKHLHGFDENYDYYNAEDTQFKLSAVSACKNVFNSKPMILSGPLTVYHAPEGDKKPDYLKSAYVRAPEAVKDFLVGQTVYHNG